MTQLARSLLVMVLLGGMLMSTLFGQAAAQASAIRALTASPCCPEDCLPKPECAQTCPAMAQCRPAPVMLGVEAGFRSAVASFGSPAFDAAADASDRSVIRGGLRRPPRT